MRAAIVNPYLDTLGGGERYTLSFARVLSELGWSVSIQWEDQSIKEKLEKRFDISFKRIEFVKDVKRGEGYDLIFWVSDGSIPTLLARRNILHFQVPFHDVGGKSLLNKMKLFRIDKIICNSEFTKKIVDKEYGFKSLVIYPPVDIKKIKSKRKQNIVLYVGRFSQLVQSKGQEVLVSVFKNFIEKGYTNWQLILAGGKEVGVKDIIQKLEKFSADLPIKIITSPDSKELINLYGTAKFFWSAAGFNVNEEKYPEKVEHFGITTVEAMAGGAVPLVFPNGGQKEIIKDGVNGFYWKKKTELVNRTVELINSFKKYSEISKEAKKSSIMYSYEEFKNKVIQLL